MNPLSDALFFLISTLFDLYIFTWLLRIILIAIRADYDNPISQIVVKVTQPIITPLRKKIPNYKNIELGSVVMVLLLELIKYFILFSLLRGRINFAALLLVSIADALKFMINIYIWAIIIQAILSWVRPGFTPVGHLIDRITQPILKPFKRIIPPVNGFDLSPIPAFICLQLLIILIVNPLLTIGNNLYL